MNGHCKILDGRNLHQTRDCTIILRMDWRWSGVFWRAAGAVLKVSHPVETSCIGHGSWYGKMCSFKISSMEDLGKIYQRRWSRLKKTVSLDTGSWSLLWSRRLPWTWSKVPGLQMNCTALLCTILRYSAIWCWLKHTYQQNFLKDRRKKTQSRNLSWMRSCTQEITL